MRHPALRLAGIVASPSGGEGGIFGTGTEEELRKWLEVRLDALGIDPVAYSRFVLSLLRRPDSVFSPCGKAGAFARSSCRQSRAPTRPPPATDREQKRAVIQCLASAADQKCGVESLVDELCSRLRELEGGSSDDEKDNVETLNGEPKMALELLAPRDRALRYYAAFPALQPATPKKFSHKKDRASGQNNVNNSNNNISNKARNNKKTKMSITIAGRPEEKDMSYGFAKSMERERDRERELELDQLRLAQLQAKFDQSLEALWDSGPGNAQDTASIWAAPSLSIPSGPLWPAETSDAPFILPLSNSGRNIMDTPYQESIIDDSPLIPWDIDLIDVGDYVDETGNKNKTEYNVNWSNAIVQGPWAWRELGGSLATLGHSSQAGSCFLPVEPCKTPAKSEEEEVRPSHEVANVQEPDEDLLTSARTHFRPIKEDGHWADGTTFPVNNSLERVAYRRSESGNLLYLPGGESPYMEYRESTSPLPATIPATLTLKFRVRQCDKCVQTEPIRSPAKRRILSDADHFYFPPDREEEGDIIKIPETTQLEEHCFTLDQLGWIKQRLPLHNDRKRRHSSSLRCRPLASLRPLTL
ncbi:uncharacterized protein LOC105688889 isoform X2 [Athalia rosae]|uniref:uncharacterized protein LOC105688889 isoform X2 n=1 Tax=Athalia rosae TaxID=37344 RepID=UPI00203380E5|nr:uncharacterized protein LOC105688889 isoform X2 [Athalia rosae]